jgi:hypothetical protein
MTDQTLVPVAVACRCPGTPHDGDTVYLRPHLDLRGGMIAQRKVIDLIQARGQGADTDEILASLGEVFCLNGVVDWTFTNGDTKPVPVSDQAIRDLILDDFTFGIAVADAASDLYTPAVLDPLVAQVAKSSQASRTAKSTSARTGSSATRRKRSKPSSTTSTPTDDTATTSE